MQESTDARLSGEGRRWVKERPATLGGGVGTVGGVAGEWEQPQGATDEGELRERKNRARALLSCRRWREERRRRGSREMFGWA